MPRTAGSGLVPAEVRFWRHVAKGDPTECWLWQGCKGEKGRSEARARRAGPRPGRVKPACLTCGFPRFRPEGHAVWCEPHNASGIGVAGAASLRGSGDAPATPTSRRKAMR